VGIVCLARVRPNVLYIGLIWEANITVYAGFGAFWEKQFLRPQAERDIEDISKALYHRHLLKAFSSTFFGPQTAKNDAVPGGGVQGQGRRSQIALASLGPRAK